MDNIDIVKQRTFFEVPLHIETGEVLNKDGDLIYRLNGEEKEYIDDLHYVILRFNDNVNEFFKKYIRPVVLSRGIKVVSEIDINDHDVQNIIKKVKARKKQDKLKNNEISAIIQRVINMHQPQYMLIAFQVMLWSMLNEDMFTIKGKSIDCRFEVEVPESYWEGAKATSDLDKLLPSDTLPPEPFLDSTHPLEIMIAIVTTFLSKHPKLSEAIQPYTTRMYTGINFLQDQDKTNNLDATFLNSQLDSILSNDVEQGNSIID